MTARIKPVGDCAMAVEFEEKISPEIHRQVRALQLALERQALPGVLETVPTYCAVLVCYDPVRTSYPVLRAAAERLLETLDQAELPPCTVYELPVCYGGELGPDLPRVAQYSGRTEEEVVALHARGDYLVYMLGFTPGFPYLGGMDPAIAAPRLPSPRISIPGGSVGIAGEQTGVYPMASPGGWNLIGRTPARLYRERGDRLFLLRPGDHIQFCPVSPVEFRRIADLEAAGKYQCPHHQRQELIP